MKKKKERKPIKEILSKDSLKKAINSFIDAFMDFKTYVPGYAGPALTFFIIILIVPATSIIALSASAFSVDLSGLKNILTEFVQSEYADMILQVLNNSRMTFGSIIILVLSIYQVSRGVGNIYTISKDMFPSEELREENILGYYIYTIRITVILLAACIGFIFLIALGPIASAFNVFYGFILFRYIMLFLTVMFFFAMLYRMIPNVKIKRSEALKGGFVCALGMVILYMILSFYFRFANFSNVYGPLASIVMVFFVLNWGCQVFYFGMYVSHLEYTKRLKMRVQQVVIERMTHYGEGVTTVFGKPCYLRNVFTGEKVEIVVEKETRKRTEAYISQILLPSVYRDDPQCPQADICELCQLQYMNYLYQITHKRMEIVRSLQRYTKFPYGDDVVFPVMPANDVDGYRQFVAYPIYDYEGVLYIGTKTDKVCTFMTSCQMQDRVIRYALTDIEELLQTTNCQAYDPKTKKGLRYIVAKKINDELIIIIVTGTDGLPDDLVEGIKKIESINGLHYSINTTRRHPQYYERNIHKLYGDDHFDYEYQGRNYLISAGSYVFNTPEMEDNIIQLLVDIIDPKDHILSLFCKSGILELVLENDITAVDENRSNIEDAQENARRFGITNKTFICNNIDAEVVLQCQKSKFDTAIIQLRSKPFTPAMATSLLMAEVKNIFILSDDPHVFAKSFHRIDTVKNIERNYDLVQVLGIDKEPYTSRVTALYQLTRK